MSQRVVGTERALAALEQMRSLVDGPITERSKRLRQLVARLTDTGVWDGPEAARFRATTAPATISDLGRWLRQLDALSASSRRVVADIMASGGGDGRGGARFGPQIYGPGPGGGDPVPPPPGSDPASIRRWWFDLTPDQQQTLISNDPAQIGALDGIPTSVRDQANRVVLSREEQRLQSEVDQGPPQKPAELLRLEELRRESPRGPMSPELTRLEQQYQDQFAHWQDGRTKLDGANALQTRLDRSPPPAYLLGFDTNGPGHAIVALNDPDYTDNVVTMVPGVGSKLDGGTISGNMGRLQNIVDASQRADPGQSTSAIMWLNYDAPPAVVGQGGAALNTDPAKAGAAPFDTFEQGLRTTHETRPGGLPPHFVALGHSYGSTLIGEASKQRGGLHVDDVIVVGSPGMDIPDASALNVPGEDTRPHVWAGLAQGDPIGIADGLGATGLGLDPTDPSFGSYVFQTDPGDHSSYWNPGSSDLRNIADIVVGRYDAVTPDPNQDTRGIAPGI